MKKKLKWIILAIIIIGVIGAFMGGSSNDESDDTTTKNEPKTEENNQEQETKTYHVGEVVKVGDVEYTVNSISAEKTVGDEYLNTDAQEMFLVVNITLKNLENEPLTVSDNFFKLKLGEKEYNTDSGSAIYLGDSIIYKEVNPDATLTGTILFDVTQDTIDNQDLQLQVQTGAWGTEKEVINLH